MKPRIRLKNGVWHCYVISPDGAPQGALFAWGKGKTPFLAFFNWKFQQNIISPDLTRSISDFIARHGGDYRD